MKLSPIPFRWDGQAMRAHPQFANAAAGQFEAGEYYTLAEVQDRSSASHKHYFACINEAWMNLPEALAQRFPSAEHLRKYALIKAGYRDERSVVCATKAEAARVAAFVKPLDDYAVVIVFECTVTVYTAKSQSLRAMGKDYFQASKDDVLHALADMLGVDVEALSKAEAA
jgi:hypothetical protein